MENFLVKVHDMLSAELAESLFWFKCNIKSITNSLIFKSVANSRQKAVVNAENSFVWVLLIGTKHQLLFSVFNFE